MSNAEPWVSIVTPSYNQGRFIKETILSVLNQDYPKIEYRVMDGGSTDETLEVLRSFGGRLSYVSERDSGQADAINKGFQQAEGEIFGWLNSDDTYLPGALRKAVQYFQTHPNIDMMYGEGYHINAEGKVIERYSTEPFSMQRLSEICFICQPTVFFRAQVFREIGPLDVHLQYCPDYDYWIRIGRRFAVGYLGEYLANSRLHEETKTLSRRAEVHAEIIRVVKRHFYRVPSRWIEAYAHFYLMEKLLPKPGERSKSRQVCYSVKTISRVEKEGVELVRYSPTKAWLLKVAFRLLCLWMHLLINRRFPHKELWRDGRMLWERIQGRPVDGQDKV